MKANPLFINRLFLPLLAFCLLLSACSKNDNLQHFTVDDAASAMEWKGYLKDGSGNNGTIKIKGKVFAGEGGNITGAQISLPLSSLININLPTDELKKQLVHHLQSQDFFNMAVHPEIGFEISSLTPDKDLPGSWNASGWLTILGKTNTVSFPVKISTHGNKVEITGETSVDRTLWGMNYASDENAADGMYVKPGIDVQFKLVALKKDH